MAAGFARDTRSFAKSQLDIMRPLGELAGVAIQNARIYRKKYKIAEMLQQRLLPSNIPEIDGLDIGHVFLPARDVGGDYYDFINAGKNRVGIVVADVSGSDVEAAEYTTMGKHILRTYAREYQSPAEVLAKTNDLICEDTSVELFISLFYGVVDLNTMTLTYASAGCEPPILYKHNDRSSSALIADGILLGIRSGSSYEERTTSLEVGDTLALYTDGLPEASLNGERFGTGRIADAIGVNAHLGAQHVVNSLHDALLAFTHGRIPDDVAIVAVKIL